MQVLLNQSEVSDIVLGYVQSQLGLDDSNNFAVEVNEDGTIAVIINEDSNVDPTPATDKPAPRRRQRRQPKAEAAPVQEEAKPAGELLVKAAEELGNQNEASTQTASADSAAASATASSSAAGGETEAPAEVAAVVETPVDPQSAEPAVVVEEAPVVEAAADPVQETAPVEEPQPKPTQSLFANLRKPTN